MSIGERIKKVRRELDLTQTEFATQLGLTQNTVTRYETGDRKPSAAVLSLIVKAYNVSDSWLRTGKGEMFEPDSSFDLSEYAKQHGMTSLETEILKAYLELAPSVRENLLQHFKDRLNQPSAPSVPAPVNETTSQTEPDIMSELAELKRQNQELSARLSAMEEEDELGWPSDTGNLA